MEIKNKKILVVIAHPDDETIGCGGFLAKAAMQGATCKVLLPIKRGDQRGITHWERLKEQLTNACGILGAEAIFTQDMVSDITAEVNVHQIYSIINEYVEWADIILTHWHGDSHQAHRAVSRAVELATRPFRTQKTVLFFEIATSTDQAFAYTFSPNCFVSLNTVQAAKKIFAMGKYDTEKEGGRTPGNLENLMRLRGAQTGQDLAEAYIIGRHFIN
ncbi:PIG-L deacetylase family protein [Mucilaginibacter phyllosphaerae]